MPLAEKLEKKFRKQWRDINRQSLESEKDSSAKLDSGEWIILILGSIYIDVIFLILTIIGLIPVIGQVTYAIGYLVLNIVATGIFWFYLQYKGLGSYWWLAFGGGVANLIPIVNLFGWTACVIILYFLIKAEKVPALGKAIEKAAASKFSWEGAGIEKLREKAK